MSFVVTLRSQALFDIEAVARDVDDALAQKTGGVVAKSGDSELLCRLEPDDSGYPIAVHSRLHTKTLCPDRDSLEWKIADLLRDPQLGRRLLSMMSD